MKLVSEKSFQTFLRGLYTEFFVCKNQLLVPTVSHMWYGLGKSVDIWSRTWDIFSFLLWLKCSFGEVHFAENLNWIKPVVPKLWAIEGFSKQLKIKEFISFSGYLTINAPDFRLIISADQNTYGAQPNGVQQW